MAASSDGTALADQPGALEQYRRELTGYCYRMLGSGFEAEDAVQETMVRAWRAAGRLRGPLVRAVVALPDRHQRVPRHAPRPPAAGPADGARAVVRPRRVASWARCCPSTCGSRPSPTTRVLPEDADPAEVVEARETIRLAFVTALQHLPPRQRAVLILCEVLRWQATEVAELLDTTVPAVNSALQRARATLAADPADSRPDDAAGRPAADLLARYVDAFERYDMSALVALLHEDAVQSMPPYAMWMQGARGHRHAGWCSPGPAPAAARG